MKKRMSNKPVTVNEDVWFYENEKSFGFVVWTRGNPKQVREFNLPHSKIRKYLPSNRVSSV